MYKNVKNMSMLSVFRTQVQKLNSNHSPVMHTSHEKTTPSIRRMECVFESLVLF